MIEQLFNVSMLIKCRETEGDDEVRIMNVHVTPLTLNTDIIITLHMITALTNITES